MDRFAELLPHVLRHEGGYVNHPRDPGGATNRGITQKTYDGWRARRGEPVRSVRSITAEEVAAIYRRDYWDAVRGDDLPVGVDYAVFDYAVNSGVSRAAKALQRVLNVSSDGRIGPATIAAAHAAPRLVTVERLCDQRLAFLKRLRHWPTFGRGWASRVAAVRALALSSGGAS